jgi:nicotinate-nucleotide adenylyltransferase
VAFFGGSFDPPHLGHLAVALAALEGLRLDTVLFAPVGIQPLKSRGAMASFDDRLAMIRLAIAGHPGFEVSLVDGPNIAGKPNYSLETLKRLRAELGSNCSLYFLMGADSFLNLKSWHRASEIPFAAELIVASRPGQQIEDVRAALPEGLTIEAAPGRERAEESVEVRAYRVTNDAGAHAGFYLLPGLDCEISASEIRARMRVGECVGTAGGQLIPASVADYVRSNGLYR